MSLATPPSLRRYTWLPEHGKNSSTDEGFIETVLTPVERLLRRRDFLFFFSPYIYSSTSERGRFSHCFELWDKVLLSFLLGHLLVFCSEVQLMLQVRDEIYIFWLCIYLLVDTTCKLFQGHPVSKLDAGLDAVSAKKCGSCGQSVCWRWNPDTTLSETDKLETPRLAPQSWYEKIYDFGEELGKFPG